MALTPESGRVAVDVRRITSKEFAARIVAGASGATRLPGGLILVNSASFAKSDLETLAELGAVHAVYRHGRVTAIPLPEVRIEFDDPAARARVHQALARSGIPHRIESDAGGLVVVSPVSNRGEDALDLANFVFENARPATAAPRIVQVVPRPDQSTTAGR